MASTRCGGFARVSEWRSSLNRKIMSSVPVNQEPRYMMERENQDHVRAAAIVLRERFAARPQVVFGQWTIVRFVEVGGHAR
jgi:hypothetical protein